MMMIGILSEDAVLNVNVGNTYYVIAYLHLTTPISILFGIIGIGYWIMQKADRKLSKWLNWTHIGLTFSGTLVVLPNAVGAQTRVVKSIINTYL